MLEHLSSSYICIFSQDIMHRIVALNRYVYDHEIVQHMHCVILLCFSEKKLFLLNCVIVNK